jgi:hypothetical protein
MRDLELFILLRYHMIDIVRTRIITTDDDRRITARRGGRRARAPGVFFKILYSPTCAVVPGAGFWVK